MSDHDLARIGWGALLLAWTSSAVLPDDEVDPAGGGEVPNILLLIADDQGWAGLSTPMHPDLPGASHELIRTPHIDSLGRDGLRFSNAYSPAPVCAPSRVGIQTGKNPAALGWTGGTAGEDRERGRRGGGRFQRSLEQDEVTVAELLRGAGYSTAHFGKWHLGGGGPGKHGYDEHDGDTNNRDAGEHRDPNPVDIFGMVERTEAFMTKAAKEEKPFFAQLSFYALHEPQNARAETIESVRKRGRWRNERDLQRAAIAEDLDAGVGRLLRVLEELGLDESTIVVYTSDNGQAGRRRGGALSGGKGGVEEGGIRVPFLVRGPGIPSGTWSHVPIVGFDLLPTFAELAGSVDELPERLAGTSLAALFCEPEGELEREGPGLVFHFPQPDVPSAQQAALRAGDLKLAFDGHGNAALYDLAHDPGERRDLASEMPEEVERLRALLEARLDEFDASLTDELSGDGDEGEGRRGRREGRRRGRDR